MGRSQLQGTPWHYEYNKGDGINNSKNCVFNTGVKCSCIISPNHNNLCVGKLNCEEFERSSFRNPDVIKTKKATVKYTDKITDKSKKMQKKLNKNKQKNKNKMVEVGSKVTVKSLSENEQFEIGKISSIDNPFYKRAINEIVTVKGIKYKIVKII